MMMPRSSSSGMQRIRRELQRRKHKALAPTPPVTKKTSALPPPSPREAVRDRIREPRTLPPREGGSSGTVSQSRGAHALPPRHPRPHASSAASATPAPPPPIDSSSARSTCSATTSTAGHLKPGTRVSVRTRSQAVVDGKTIVLWLAATVVSATDESYEVVYEGNLPRDNPFSTVHVPIHHVSPIKTTPPPPSRPPSAAAASLSASATNTQFIRSKNGGTQQQSRQTTTGKRIRSFKSEEQPPLMPVSSRAARSSSSAGEALAAATSKRSEMLPKDSPTTAGKSLRLIGNSASEMQPPRRSTTAGKSLRKSDAKPAPRPTTAGKRISVIRRTLSEKDRQVLDASCSKLGFVVSD